MSDKKLQLDVCGVDYLDRTHFLLTGEVVPEGIDLTYRTLGIGQIFRRMIQDEEFDASEMSASSYMVMRATGDERFVGIPVFPARAFRQRHIYVRTGRGIDTPQDLKGRVVGVSEYQITAALWIRAFLQHDYGVAPQDIRWRQGAYDTGYVFQERLAHDTPEGVELELIPEDKTIIGMLETGELDAVATTHPPRPFWQGDPNIVRLFPDYKAVETDYFRRTGFFPIMHMWVVRRDVYEQNPWVARALFDAFVEAKRIGREKMWHLDEVAVPDPFWESRLVEIREVFDGDPFPYGLAANRDILEAMTQYSYEQGLSKRKLDPAELIAPELQDS